MSSTAKITIDETYGMVSERTRYLYSEKATYQSGLQIGGLTIISASALALDVTGLVNLRSVSITDLIVTDVIATNAIITNISAGSLNLSGNANVANLTVRGSASVTLDEAVVGNFNLTGNMTVSGTTLLQGLLTAAQGAIIRNGSATVTDLIVTSVHATTISVVTLKANTLTVGGDSQLQTLTATSSTLGATGVTNLSTSGQVTTGNVFVSSSQILFQSTSGVGTIFQTSGGLLVVDVGTVGGGVNAGGFEIRSNTLPTLRINNNGGTPTYDFNTYNAVKLGSLGVASLSSGGAINAGASTLGNTSATRIDTANAIITSLNTTTASVINIVGTVTVAGVVVNAGSISIADAIITNAHITTLSALNVNINTVTTPSANITTASIITIVATATITGAIINAGSATLTDATITTLRGTSAAISTMSVTSIPSTPTITAVVVNAGSATLSDLILTSGHITNLSVLIFDANVITTPSLNVTNASIVTITGTPTIAAVILNAGSATLTDLILTNAHVTNLSALNANINALTVGGNTQLQTLTTTTVTLGATGVTNLSTSGALIAGATGVGNLSALNAQIDTLTVAGASTFAAIGVSSLSTSGALNTGNITTLSGSTITGPGGISFAPTAINLQSVAVSNLKLGAVLTGPGNGNGIVDVENIYRSITTRFVAVYGGTTTAGQGALLTAYGKDISNGSVELYTPNAANSADNIRLTVAGNADTAVATWANVTHSGLVITNSNKITFNSGLTGGGTALLGTNCPADTVNAPATWLSVKTVSGSVVYIPAWM